MKNIFKIGWSEVDITPCGEVELFGQYYRRLSRGVHSRIGATAMAIDGGNGQCTLMISIDVVNFSGKFFDEFRENLKNKLPELDTSKLIMNAIHTHSAPQVDSGKCWWEKSDSRMLSYHDFVIRQLCEAAAIAWNTRQPAGIASTFDFATVGHCRRAVYSNKTAEMYGDTSRADFIGMEGGEDSTIELLFAFDGNSKPTGVIVNVACPSQIMEATYLISSDYMGKVRQLLKEKFGPDFHVLCQISAAGCQSPRDMSRTRDDEFWGERGVDVIGRRVFDAVMRGYQKIAGQINFKPELVHNVKELELPRRRASYVDYTMAAEDVERLEKIQPEQEAFVDFCADVKVNEEKAGRPGPYDSKLHHFVLIKNAQAVMDRYNEQHITPDYKMELHTVKLGDVVFVTNPFELFLDYGLQMKARSKARQTFVVQLACGSGAYLPTERAEQLGGYGGLIINGEVGSDGGKMLVDYTVKSINDLFS
ncbi:MAG TPA: hypothetical protein PLK08_02685 [Phycisphaerae bacterium]|nr:hypothetical protein [Phycisphaerae bacterium]